MSPLLIAPAKVSDQRMPLICFPYAGANPYIFTDWRARVLPQLDVIGIHLPGRGVRLKEPSFESISEMVSETVQALGILQLGSFAFYGHSLGALVAFEVARRMRKLGMPQPTRMFVGGARPPHMPALTPHLHPLDQAAFLAAVQARYGGIPDSILQEPELLQIFLPALRADFAAYETYEHQAEQALACPISAFSGAQDTLVTSEMMSEWGRHTSSTFDLSVLPGDHFFLAPSRDQLLASILRKLPITR